MTASTETETRLALVPRSTDNGLWTALAARLSDRSAAGSGLAEPTGLGQPISAVVDMFAYRAAKARPVPEPLHAA